MIKYNNKQISSKEELFSLLKHLTSFEIEYIQREDNIFVIDHPFKQNSFVIYRDEDLLKKYIKKFKGD